jgi:hypothetical protein
MNNPGENNLEEAAEPVIRQGKSRWGTHVPGSGTASSKPEPPRVIETQHRPPEPRPPHWRSLQAVNAERQKHLDQAAEAKAKAADIERYYDGLERRLNSLAHVMEIKGQELNKVRQQLAALDPATLKARFDLAFARRDNFHGDRHEMSEWFDVAALRANAKELRAMLTEKISAAELEIADSQKERDAIEAELNAAAEGNAKVITE